MADAPFITGAETRAIPTIHPQISDAVATAAVKEFYLNDFGPTDTQQRYAMRAAISAAILADREESAKEIARLKAELADANEATVCAYMLGAEKAKDEISRLKEGFTHRCADLDLEIIELRRERNESRVDAERLRADVEKIAVAVGKERSEVYRLQKELCLINAAIGSVRFMDPPDGGDVSIEVQVSRMRCALDAAEAEIARLKSDLAIAETATRKALEAVPIAMDAAVMKERSELLDILAEARSGLCAHTGGEEGACKYTIAKIDAAIRARASEAN